MQKVLLTGSSGFVGKSVAGKLADAGYSVRRAVRAASGGDDAIAVGSIGPHTDWSAALEGCSAVIHLAAALPGKSATELKTTNDEGTRRLVDQAIEAKVGCLIAASSIATVSGNHADDTVNDGTPVQSTSEYGASKLATERHVASFAADERCAVSLRPPLVYGAEASGNWGLLQKLAATGLPLPFGAVRNRRTMISVDALADAILAVLRNATPDKSGAYAVADSESISLAQIMTLLREGMGRRPRLVPVPATLMKAPLKLSGRGTIAQSLFGNLEVDASRFRQTFDWRPAETAPDAIRRCGREFAAIRR